MKRNPESISKLLAQLGVTGAYVFIPLLLSAGILSRDARNRRVLLWHSAGLTRDAYVLGRFGFVLTQSLIALVLPIIIAALLTARSEGDYPHWSGTSLALAVGIIQVTAVLTLLSSILPSFWNSVASMGVVFLEFLYLLEHQQLLIAHFTTAQLHLIKTLLISPYAMAIEAASHQRYSHIDLPASLVLSVICIFLACVIYRAKQLSTASRSE